MSKLPGRCVTHGVRECKVGGGVKQDVQFTEDWKPARVRRLHSACCGMELGKIYEAKINDPYVCVLLDDGSWTSPHFVARDTTAPWFEILPNNY